MDGPAKIAELNKGEETRERIKSTARDLFSRYGIDKVTIRDIAKYAGQKNGGSVNYYFRSKDHLIREIIADVAGVMDVRRGLLLDKLEASGKPITLRAIIRTLVPIDQSEWGLGSNSMRLLTMLQYYRRDLMHTVIPGTWDRAYHRCLEHLRGLLPDHSAAIFKQRFYFLIPYLWTFLATREGEEDQAHFWKDFWADPSTIETLLDTAEAILIQPTSAETLRAIAGARGDVSQPAEPPARARRKGT
jgi:AcrR family transcriptional regulator